MVKLFGDNIGGKIRYTAIALFIVGTLITIIIGIVNIVNSKTAANVYSDMSYIFYSSNVSGGVKEAAMEAAKERQLWTGLAFLFLGPFVSWVVSLALYGEGVALDTQLNSYLSSHRITKNDYFNKN